MAEPIHPPQTPKGALQIDLGVIEAAATRIRPHVYKTPLLESPRLNDFLGYRLLIKAEVVTTYWLIQAARGDKCSLESQQ